MKVIVIGAAGTIGRAIVEELAPRHEIVTAGRSSGQARVDITRIDSVHTMFEQIGKADAVVVAAGSLHLGPLADATPERLAIGLQSKLMGQVNVALAAQRYLNDGGSITLTSGIAADQPVRYIVNAAMVNSAVEGFARGAAIELPRGLRINVVNPTVLEESMEVYGSYFIGFEPVPAKRVAKAYSRSVDGLQTGQVYKVW